MVGRTDEFYEQYKVLTDALRPWTIDFHVAQNDATVFGSGSHDKTGRHCLPDDPNGKLDIPKAAGYWLRDANGDGNKNVSASLLGRVHVPQRDNALTRNVEQNPRRHVSSTCGARLGGVTKVLS